MTSAPVPTAFESGGGTGTGLSIGLLVTGLLSPGCP